MLWLISKAPMDPLSSHVDQKESKPAQDSPTFPFNQVETVSEVAASDARALSVDGSFELIMGDLPETVGLFASPAEMSC